MDSVESVEEQVLFNNYLFEMKISKYLKDSDLKKFSETCKSAHEISNSTLIKRKFNFFNSQYLKRFRKLYDNTVVSSGDRSTINLNNYLRLCRFFISKEYITLTFFRRKPLFFENVMSMLNKALDQLDEYTPGLLKEVQEYSDKIQNIYANIPNY